MILRVQPVSEERLSPLVGDLYDLGCVEALYTFDRLLVAVFDNVDKAAAESFIDREKERFEWQQ